MKSKRKLRHLTLLPLLLFPCLISAATDAIDSAATTGLENNQVEVEDIYGWHEVKPGETLGSIALKYYGAKDQWKAVSTLNPDIKNPDFITPGTKLRVVTGKRVIEPPPTPPVIEEIEAASALVMRIANTVEKSLQRSEWQNAANGDALEPRDGVRTLGKSSAELQFDDETELRLTEYSQIYLRERVDSKPAVSRNAIEIERGQADLSIKNLLDRESGIEIVIGESISRPAADKAGQAETRARREDNGYSAFMVYSGSSEVEASGTTVNVADGMGTRVIPGQPPSKPEKLLSAVTALSPVNLQRAGNSMDFKWQPLPGAAQYTLEICADTDCAQLFNRKTGIVQTAVTMDGFPTGEYFWRVTATSASGLDGYLGTTNRFNLTEPEKFPLTTIVWIFDAFLLMLFLFLYQKKNSGRS